MPRKKPTARQIRNEIRKGISKVKKIRKRNISIQLMLNKYTKEEKTKGFLKVGITYSFLKIKGV